MTQIRRRYPGLARNHEPPPTAHPTLAAAVAVGAGYLVGGGLFSGLTARVAVTILKLGLRVAVVPFVTQSLLKLSSKPFSPKKTTDGVLSSPSALSSISAWRVFGLNQAALLLVVPKSMPRK